MSTAVYTPICKFNVLPSYQFGFAFSWTVDPTFADPLSWKFYVEESEFPNGPWKDISPELDFKFYWMEGKRRVTSKDHTLYFRLRLITGTSTYYSAVIAPYFDLPKREFLLVKEIMRNELQQQRRLAGVHSRIWLRTQAGPKCPACSDPVLGGTVNSHCPQCYGTGRVPGYTGPYPQWITFAPPPRQHIMESDQTANRQAYDVQCRIIGYPLLSKRDILVDPRADKRYFVDIVNNIVEIRKVPVVQVISATELPNSEPVYKLPL